MLPKAEWVLYTRTGAFLVWLYGLFCLLIISYALKENRWIYIFFWEGPYLISQLKELSDDNRDYGIYQVYGQHSLYGNSILLYIGQANEQTFGKLE